MRVLSVCRSAVRTVVMQDRPVPTGIYKEPVDGAVAVHPLGLDGDEQADLTVHGGPHQAVYAYPSEHYHHWEEFLGREGLPYGTFGENVTTIGLLETEVFLGDIHRYGTALLQVTSTRLPCFKFAHKVANSSILKPFTQSGYSGFYYRVLEPGTVAAGDPLEIVERDAAAVTVREALGLYRLNEGNDELLERALRVEALSPLFRDAFLKRLHGAA